MLAKHATSMYANKTERGLVPARERTLVARTYRQKQALIKRGTEGPPTNLENAPCRCFALTEPPRA